MRKTLFIILIAGTCFTGCKKFLDVNKDPNNPVDVQESLILAPVELNISDNIQGGNVGIIVQNYVQNIAANQLNPYVGSYQLFNTDMDGDWTNFYVTSLNNLITLNKKAEANGNYNYAAIAKILTAYTLGTATDFWGDIPYSKGFSPANFLVPYDKQEDIYKSIQSLLTNAIADIDKNSNVKTPSGDDYFYNGDMSRWRKLAWSLKARYFIHLTKAPGYTAANQASQAMVALQQGMMSNDDDMKFNYTGAAGSENIWYLTFTPVTTYVMNATLVDSLVNRNDPRLSKIVLPASATSQYTGRRIGTATGTLESYSYPAAFYSAKSSSNYIFSYSEALFVQAEALLITQGAAAAQPVYVRAINSHLSKLGIDTTSAAALSYVQRRALSGGNALQRIMEEKAVANIFNFETYNDWRRTGYPALKKVDGALIDIPRRLLYPQSEILSNPQPQQTAVQSTRIWWDVSQ